MCDLASPVPPEDLPAARCGSGTCRRRRCPIDQKHDDAAGEAWLHGRFGLHVVQETLGHNTFPFDPVVAAAGGEVRGFLDAAARPGDDDPSDAIAAADAEGDGKL